MQNSNKRIAIVPGSFDPITYGHIDIVQRAAEEYDHVYLAVMINREKSYMFTIEQRKRIALAAVAKLPNVEVISSEGMLWELAKELQACAIVKGYRNEVDLTYEERMADYNRSFYPEAQTILLPSDPNLLQVSSTLVRDHILHHRDLTPYMPQEAIDEIYRILPRTI